MRSKAYQIIRTFYHERQFVEVETPVLIKVRRKGSALVPSRVNPGKFFALPQVLKPITALMTSGFDQCWSFRDEDLRADVTEFTQIDVEMSFVDEDQIYSIHEELISRIFKETIGVELVTQFPRMSYDKAMNTLDPINLIYGLDVSLLISLILLLRQSLKCFPIRFRRVVALWFTIPGQGTMGRGAIDRWTERVKKRLEQEGLFKCKRMVLCVALLNF